VQFFYIIAVYLTSHNRWRQGSAPVMPAYRLKGQSTETPTWWKRSAKSLKIMKKKIVNRINKRIYTICESRSSC